MRNGRILGLLVVGAAALVAVGCGDGPRMAEVKGTVQYDGQLIDEGTIQFTPLDGKGPTAGGDIKDGKYTARAPVGPMRVSVSWQKTYAKKKLYDTPESPEIPLKKESLPEKYSDQTKSELTYEVKPGANEKNWSLEK